MSEQKKNRHAIIGRITEINFQTENLKTVKNKESKIGATKAGIEPEPLESMIYIFSDIENSFIISDKIAKNVPINPLESIGYKFSYMN